MKGWLSWLAQPHLLWGLTALVLSLDLLLAAFWEPWSLWGVPNPLFLCAVLGMVCGIAVMLRQNWIRWPVIGWLVLSVVVLAAISWPQEGFPILASLRMVVLTVAAYAFWKLDFSGDEDESEKDRPFLSLVLLVREPRYLDATILASLASRAWGIEVSGQSDVEESAQTNDNSGDEDEDGAFIVGESPLFIGKHPKAMLIIHNFDRPYYDDPGEVAEDIIEARARHAMEQHRGWIAVDVLHWLGEGDGTEEAYRMIARLLAELADDNVLAVVDPDAGQIFCYDPETERKLRSENPLAELREAYYVPIISVSSEDPRMQAAVAEARNRWPEFVAAFERRDPSADDHYAIKVPFGDEEHREFMWVDVTGIENDVIYGTLENEPAQVPGLACGDRVRVELDQVNDWLLLIDGELIGGFTRKVLSDRAQEGGIHEAED